MKPAQGWDMEAALRSGPVRRVVDVFCYACMVFDALAAELLVGRFV